MLKDFEKYRIHEIYRFEKKRVNLLDKQGKGPKEIISTLGEVPESNGRKEEINFLLCLSTKS